MTARARALAVTIATVLLLVACAPAAPEGSPGTQGEQSESASPSPRVSPNASASQTASTSPTASASPTLTPAPSGTIYRVQRGDSLSAIAIAYGTTVDQLVSWNVTRYPSLGANTAIIEPDWELVVSDRPGATPRPIATPAPTPVPPPPPPGARCSAGNRVPSGSAQTFATIPNAGPGVALTFDMGGRMDPAVDIMNFLVANQVCATIFATGVMSQTPQGEQVMAIIRAHPELFEIANHTMYHCDLVRGGAGSPTTTPCQTGGRPSADFVRRELTDADAILRAGTGQSPQPYWRPPYGSVDQAVIDAAASVGYTKTFMWDIDTIDWRPISQGGPTAEQIAAKVVGNAVNGSNVLFHLGGFETLDALRLLVPGLRDRGFALTSLSDLLQ